MPQLEIVDAQGRLRAVSPDNPLPTSGGAGGGSTDITTLAKEAKQDTGNASLATIVARDVDVTASGPISTQNLNPLTGVPTTNSTVELTVAGRDHLLVQVVGTYTGALTMQGTVDGTNWVSLTGGVQFINMATGGGSGTIGSATQGIFQSSVGAFTKVRVTALAAVTGSAAITMRAVDGNGMVALDAPLPAGTSSIGNIGTVATLTTLGTITNTVPTQEVGAATVTTGGAQVSVSTTTAQLAPALTTRKAVIIYNGAATPLFVNFGAAATLTAFATAIPAAGTLVIPRETFTGAVHGILGAGGATGNAQVTVVSP